MLHPIDHNLWAGFFNNGLIDKVELKKSIESSYYFENEKTPDWIKLWSFIDMDDYEFEKISKNTIQYFNNEKVQNKEELLHIFGTLLTLSNEKLISLTTQEIFDIGRKNIEKLRRQETLKLYKNEEFPSIHSYGRAYNGRDFLEYKDFLELLLHEITLTKKANELNLAKELLNLLAKSEAKFSEKLAFDNLSGSLYYDEPILHTLPIDEFVDILLNLSNKEKRHLFCVTIKHRYKPNHFNSKLQDELLWLEELLVKLNFVKHRYTGKLTEYIFERSILPILTVSIEQLKAESSITYG